MQRPRMYARVVAGAGGVDVERHQLDAGAQERFEGVVHRPHQGVDGAVADPSRSADDGAPTAARTARRCPR